MKIAVDAMGGDYAPVETVKGAVEASQELGLEIILVGDEVRIKKELAQYEIGKAAVSVIHAPEVIEMGEAPGAAIRKKKNSSIVVSTRLVKEGAADAVVSAGNTGAAMGAALLGLGRIKGIHRPAIASVLPTVKGRSLFLDVGANAVCDPQNLLQFAVMGSIYSNKILGATNPRIGLLNIGEEETKGNPLYVEAYQLIKESGLNFVGNVEGRDITGGIADVIVCDGFVGNIVLKFGEGLAKDLMSMLREEFMKNIFVKIGAALVFSQAKGLRKKIDYAESGGAPLLGVNGVAVISHGSSQARAIKNAIRVAKECVEIHVVNCIKDSITEKPNGDDDSASG
ncbi:phosphate acyltransferase PlsX [Phosphitispora fastidiosa]|uniref:phosphate acyltransferase PlsX n=1 Tax=Phosphitispora fastidiosa TaxID=2837202 RepID=UPI001E337BED|nr:phosphate acyltransferase PlsX [Phosphitispora fastidiosa]MBU7005486.1 glycerol-3-phosphate acyltransferase PlsX [Phosphitispora fastidiosa]